MFAQRTGRRAWRALSMMMTVAIVSACSEGVPERKAAPADAESRAAAAPAAPVAKSSPKPEAVSPFLQLHVETFLKPDRPLEARDYVWDASGAPAGPLRIVVDIAAQRVYVYRGNAEIGRSTMIYGADDKPTPFGTFPILQKNKDHVSNLYDAEMPYMMRLTWDGVAIHGSEVEDWAATNGCIGVPDDFAALLFAEVKLGDKVLVTNNWMPDIYGTETAA